METGTMEPYEITSWDHGNTVTLWGPMEYGYRTRVVWAEFGYVTWPVSFPVWRIYRSDLFDPRDSRAHVVECIDADGDADLKEHLLAYLPE